MDKPPYVGITGFMDSFEVDQCLGYWAKLFNYTHPCRRLMVGILVSSKTITGQTNSLSNKFPKRESISKIPVKTSYVFNCLHFATGELESFYDHLMLALEYGEDMIDGIQLNMVWPDPKVLERIKTQYPRLQFVLQISPHLAGYSVMTPHQITRIIYSLYDGLADYALIDFSRGLGQQMPLEEVSKYLQAIAETNPQIGLVTCGGLHAINLRQLVSPLAAKYPNISIDAEGRLRDDSPDGGQLILPKCFAYLKEASEILK